MLALDRVLAQPQELVERIEAHDTPLARLASDHLPVKAVIRLDGTAARRGVVHPEVPALRRRLLSRLLRGAAGAMRLRLVLAAAALAASAAARPERSPSARPTPTTTGS